MISNEFEERLANFPHLKKYFDGTVSSDTIPKVIKKDHFIICNTDTSSGPGKHWYCVLKSDSNVLECFDSLGIDNDKKKFLQENFKLKGIKCMYVELIKLKKRIKLIKCTLTL